MTSTWADPPFSRRLARFKVRLQAGVAVTLAIASSTVAGQELTPDPSAWRPLSYADLRQPTPASRTYLDIWRDDVDANNRLYAARGDTRFRGANAPATEAHFVIWSPKKSAVLSILNTATGCTLKEIRAGAHTSVKLCPVRLAIYEGISVQVLEGGRACFLEVAASADPSIPSRAVAYASYDLTAKIVKLGVVIDHQPVEGCALDFPLYPS